MIFKLYELLEIDKNASQDEIKKAYRKLAVQNHPDKGGDQEKFKEISNAYQVLSDENKKRTYDQIGDQMFNDGNAGGGDMNNFQPMNPSDLFANLFGGGNPFGGGGGFDFPGMHMHGFNGNGQGQEQQIKRNDHVHNLTISLNEAFFGFKKSIKVTVVKICLSCKSQCNTCQGRGQITEMRRMGPFTQMITQACPVCNGSGETSQGKSSCIECNGTCKIQKDHKLELDIPRGVSNGYEQKFKGFGDQKQNKKDIAGDLIFRLSIKDDILYKRRDNDLIHTENISFKESIIGKKINLEYFGEKLEIDLRKYTVIQPGKEYILKGKGMPINNGISFGNMILIFNIKYPSIGDTIINTELENVCSELTKLGIE